MPPSTRCWAPRTSTTRCVASTSARSCRSSTDRKSTRLNSSHSLPAALPIWMVISAADGHATIYEMLGAAYIDDALRGFYEREELPLFYRSEEHTSELQSLPTRRSSDLDGDLGRRRPCHHLRDAGRRVHRRRAAWLLRARGAAALLQIGRAHV